MAARSLRNLSWKADRTKRTPNIRYPRGLGQLDVMNGGVGYKFLDESYDEANSWIGME